MALTCAARYGALLMAVWACASSTDDLGVPATAPGPIECPVSRTVRETLRDPNSDPISGEFYANDDRSIWAGPAREHWRVGPLGDKMAWYRPAGAELVITGRRLDAIASPLKVSVPCCYPTRFQMTGVVFPTEGCWEITGRAGGKQLTFVARIRP